jgi:hypothetical protein
MKGHMSDSSQPRAFKNYLDLSNSAEQERLSPAGIEIFVNITKIWSLEDAQALGLLGVVTASTLLEWKTGMEGRALDEDRLMRISFLIGIFKGAQYLPRTRSGGSLGHASEPESPLHRRGSGRLHDSTWLCRHEAGASLARCSVCRSVTTSYVPFGIQHS